MSNVAVPNAGEPANLRARALIGGEWREARRYRPVVDPFRGHKVGEVAITDFADLDAAIAAAVIAKPKAAALPGYKRAELLRRVGELLERRADEIALVMAQEMGKAIKDAQGEVRRSKDTISLSAEEAIRIEGQHIPLDGSEMGAGKLAMLLRFPVGVVAAITPFNAPFNLACHKLAPAIAAGNTVVLKPPPQTPLVVHKLVELFVDAGLPPGFINVVHGDQEIGRALVRDPRVDFITFTGSSRAGADIKAISGLKRATLELGGNGPTIVHDDADISVSATACGRNAARLAGQSCISVQNVFVHRTILDRFVDAMANAMRALRIGDPLDSNTDVGTLIDESAAQRVESWVAEAIERGARVVTGGKRKGAQMEPTLLVDVDPTTKIVCEEVFGPVASILPYTDIGEVFQQVSASPHGLQCGLFTRSNEVTFRAIRELRTGGIIVNGTSTWRTDQLAYGGIKASGIGREGPRYAIRDMTEERLVLFNL
jgi:acyl-CoA reductase-like NAD-dependent aldehyde dehydrogenase